MTILERFQMAKVNIEEAEIYLNTINNFELDKIKERLEDIIERLNTIPQDKSYWSDFE